MYTSAVSSGSCNAISCSERTIAFSLDDQFRISYDQGRKTYGQMTVSRDHFLEALRSLYCSLDIINGDSLAMDHVILTTDKDVVLQAVRNRNLSEEDRFQLASTLRWLGHCYQNIDTTRCLSQDNLTRFHNLYHLAEKLLLLGDSKETRLELAELYYNAYPFMHQLENPEDRIGAYHWYEKAMEYNSSNAMQVRVLNMKLRLLPFSPNERLDLQRQVLSLYLEIPECERDPFLVAMYRNNLAQCLILQGNPAEAKALLKETVAYCEENHEKYHSYFPLFYFNLAMISENEEAIPLLRTALELCKKNEKGSEAYKLKIQEALSKLEG
ncbi:MAG: tetratricopeptide repeat protein [Chlamydiales bacterium]|nr:tetratricopeptide repeat protein [Chlamydiia bacterium]MCP5507627.1 tetratricopeptide repeat protein [Chlamydiales bacterium]